MNIMPIGHHSKLCDLSQMSLLPTGNHNLIIQTCVEKEVEPCNIKINDRRGCKYTTVTAKKKKLLTAKWSMEEKTIKIQCSTIVAILIKGVTNEITMKCMKTPHS